MRQTLQMRAPTELRRAVNLLPPACKLDLYLKLEHTNPTGTYKDRVAERVVGRARDSGYECVTAGTCGNYGVALARCCSQARLRCHVFVPSHYEGSRQREISRYGGEVFTIEGTYEDAVALSQAHAHQRRCYDANPFGEAGELALAAYEDLAREIAEQLPAPPTSVWVPVGNGTALGGMFRGFQSLGIVPRFAAVGSYGNTSASASARLGRVIDLDPNLLRESITNEPLVNWRSSHADLVIEAIRRSRGYVYEASDDEMLTGARTLLEREGLAVAPAAAATLAALQHNLHNLDSGPHVLLLTGAASPDNSTKGA